MARQVTSNLTYSASGVSIERGNALVKKISLLVAATSRDGFPANLAGFGAIGDLSAAGYTNPVLVMGTDGVGTKLILSQKCNDPSCIGQDLVAMCVNDILTHNAEPLCFLDYYSCSKLDVDFASRIVDAIAKACQIAGCALVGGETAEMPDVYSGTKYDLAGFALGAYDKFRHIPMPRLDKIHGGDVVIGISSTGLHSNGFSLVRMVLNRLNFNLEDACPFEPNKAMIDCLLTPTAIYSKPLLPVLRTNKVKAAAHITGGGIIGNLKRVIPGHLCAILNANDWKIHPVFGWLSKMGNVSPDEMLCTFNCGIGMCLIVGEREKPAVLEQLEKLLMVDGLEAHVIGSLVKVEGHGDFNESNIVVENFNLALQTSWTDNQAPVLSEYQHRLPTVAVLTNRCGPDVDNFVKCLLSKGNSYTVSHVILWGQEDPCLSTTAGVTIHRIWSADQNSTDSYQSVDKILLDHGIGIVCLWGFNSNPPDWFLEKWQGKILKSHPSLLPSFRGQDAIEQALDMGVCVTGCTVHFAATGAEAAIIAQEPVMVSSDDVTSLAKKISAAETVLFPRALELVSTGGKPK